jgi:hypothetical protein
MFRNVRLVISLGLLSGVSLAGVVGWATGFFDRAWQFVSGHWAGFMELLNSPWSWEMLMVGAGVLLVPIVILIVIFAIADG